MLEVLLQQRQVVLVPADADEYTAQCPFCGHVNVVAPDAGGCWLEVRDGCRHQRGVVDAGAGRGAVHFAGLQMGE